MPEKINVLLIDPSWNILSEHNIWKNIGSCLPSLGLAYIASYLEKNGYSVKIIDCTAEELTIEKLKQRFENMPCPDFIGLTATTPLIKNCIEITKLCKSIFKNSKIIVGGVHASVMPAEVLKNDSIDYVARGEGEETMLELVKNEKNIENITGLSFKRNREIIHNPERELIKDLNVIPPPAYHLLPMDKYHPALGSYKRLPAMSLFATRGCPGKCTFCYRTFQGKVRKRSAENIIEEINLLKNKYGIKEIAFYDDTFTAFKDEVMKFCQLLIEWKIDITWSCFTRVDFVNENLLRIMKKAGCHLILFGVESADETILKNVKKKISLDKALAVVRLARKIGVNTRASFMIGNQGETEETVKKTVDFAFHLDADEIQFNIATAYPGTELYNWAKQNGYLAHDNWDNYNMSDLNLKLPDISQEKLQYYYAYVHKKYYIRPKIILRRLFHIRTFTQFMQEVKGFFAIINVFRHKK